MRKHYMLLSHTFGINGFIGEEKFESFGTLVFDKNKKQIWLNVCLPDNKKLSIPLMPIKIQLIAMFKFMELKDQKEILIELETPELYHGETEE